MTEELDMNLESLKDTEKDLQEKERELTLRIENYRLKILTLTEEEAKRRREMGEFFKKRHEKSFKDVNFKHALIGSTKIKHAINVSGLMRYFISPPNGAIDNQIAKFIKTPKDDKGEDMSPISEPEGILLTFLVGIQMIPDENKPMPEQYIGDMSTAERLRLIRGIPTATRDRIAEECLNFQALMKIYLETELGN